jgi:CheY-like chemotaxis protein
MRVQAAETAESIAAARPATIPQIDPVPRVSIQAFCETPETAAVVQAAIGDRRMSKTHVKQNMGGAAAAVEAYRNAPTPNVIVLEATANREALVEQLDELSQFCDAGTKVIVLGRVNDIVLYRQLMARGVSEYLVAPFNAVEFVQAISHLFRQPGAKPLGRVISVVGAKGGVGSSTIAHNLSWALATGLEMATIVADFDLGFGTAGLDYNQDPPQGVAEAVFAPERVDATLIDRLLSKCGDTLHLLAALGGRHDARGGALDRARYPAYLERLDAAHADRLGRGGCRRRSGSGQSAQRQEHHRQHSLRSSPRSSGPARHQRRRDAQAAGNLGRRLRQDCRDGALRGDPA